jgi:hypothetical protein
MTFTYIPRSPEAWANRAGQKFDGQVSPTAVQNFIETRRHYIRCASCDHWRCRHCTKRKLKPGQVLSDANWRGFMDDNGEIAPCSHTLPNAQPYACSSSACTQVLGEGEDERLCDSQKFVSPNAKKRTRVPKTIPNGVHGGLFSRAALQAAHERYLTEQRAAEAGLKTKQTLLLEAAAEADLTALSVEQIAEFTDMSAAWVRKTLRAAGLLTPATPRRRTITTTRTTEAPPVRTDSAVQPYFEEKHDDHR